MIWQRSISSTKTQRRPLFRKNLFTIVAILAYVILPLWYAISYCPYNIFFVFLSYIIVLSIIVFLYRRITNTVCYWEIKKSDLYEKINLLQAEVEQASRMENILQRKKSRYLALESMMQKLSYNLSLEAVSHYIVQKCMDMIPKADIAVLYIVDEDKQRLNLVESVGEDPEFYKLPKNGDIFDKWVMKHACPLLVEDTSQDYRFDLDSLGKAIPIGSLISVPLMLEEKVIGILRIDSFDKYTFYSEDLSFLQTIGDLAAVAIGNTILYKRMEDLALHDGLTNLYMRRYILERLESIILYHKKNVFSLLMIDIDDFKKYNDTYGHTAGDIVIKNVARVLLKHTRIHKDIVARYGGEEFLVYLEERNLQAAVEIAEKIRQDIESKQVVLRRIPTSVTVSIGVASYPKDGKDKITLIKKADERLYVAKSTGKNRVCFA